jgi:hypothetical protein
MRRRPNADAPVADSSDPLVTAPDTLPIETEATENAPSAGNALSDPNAHAAPVPETETPKPARRRSPARRKAAEADAPAEAVAEIPAAPEPVVEEAAAPDPPAPRAPRRRRTARSAAPEEETVATVAEPVAPPVLEPTIEPVADTEAATPDAEARPARRRGGTRRSAASRSADPTPEGSTPPAEAASDAVEPEAPGEPRNRRSRGGRRRRTSESGDAAATESAAEIVPETPETPSDDATTERRRLRGPRRVGASAAELSLTPAEPLPPPYQALADDVLARLPETRIVVRKNIPDLQINGEPRLPLWFFVNTEEALIGGDEEARTVAQREIRLAYEAGIRFFSVLAHLPSKLRSGERRFGPLDDALQFVAENAPDALVLPRLIFSPTTSWERAHTDQMTLYPNGETGDVSLASRTFWEGDADEALRAAVEHVAQSDHAGRVFGFYLEHGEWFYEKGRGYDVSEANTQGFRAWLRSRYRNSLVALRAAWYDGVVTFETVAVPPAPEASTPGSALFFSEREQRYVDFHEYSSDVVSQVITRLGKAVKEASGGRSAVAVSYGYTLELSRAYSGHLALAQVLASPNIDILTGPVSYSGRTAGGSAPLPAPIDSINLAGKLWVSEDDTKTFLASSETPDTYNTKLSSLEATWAAYTRNFGAALTRGAGVSWMDLWGMGWLDDRELWQRIGRLRTIAEVLATRRRNPRTRPAPEPDVAVIVDERSFFDVRADESVLGHLVAHQRDALLRSGARVGFYLLSDLLKKNFPDGPKLLIFLNAFRITDALRATIRDRFQDDGRTLAWVYGPGCRESNLAELTDVIGMQLRIQPWGSKIGTQVLSNARSPITDLLRGQRVGDEVRVNPSFYVADTKATPLGEYSANGNTSIAYRKHARWQSVFIGEMSLPIPLLRGLYQLAGVPVYTVDDDVAVLGDNLISLHSAPGGGTIVHLPEEGALYDLLTEETLASDGRGARLSMPPRGTRLLFYGSAAEIARLGGDPKAGPPGLTASEAPAAPVAFHFEAADSRSLSSAVTMSAEDDALMQAALAGEMPDVVDTGDTDDDIPAARTEVATGAISEADAAAEEDAAQKKRRRRRRRGRGRSGSEEGDGVDSDAGEFDDEAPVSESPADLTVETDGVAEMIAAATPGRGRPSLAELLPDSEVVEGADLPPIPDEFLPLEPSSLAGDAGLDSDGPRRRRRGGVRRRGRGESSENGTETALSFDLDSAAEDLRASAPATPADEDAAE